MPPQQPPQEQPSSSGDFFWTVALLILAGILIWYFGQQYIVYYTLQLKLFELNALRYIFPTDFSLDQLLIRTEHYLKNPEQITFNELQQILTGIGSYYRWVVAPLLIGLAVTILLTHINSKFKSTYSMKTLVTTEKNIWPQIIPVSHENLVDEDISKGPWASALTPMLFVKKYKLVIEEKTPSDDPLDTEEKITARLDEDRARLLFQKQLGPLWQRSEALPAHRRAIFSVFATRANHDRKSAQDLLDSINRSLLHSKKPSFKGADELFKKYAHTKPVKTIEQRHAYVFSVMASMLDLARTDGVLSVADFLWLKTVDRPLWYMLSNVGRQTAFAEAAGPFAHWKIEKRMKRPLHTPMIEEAVKALKLALKDVIYVPDEKDEKKE